MGGGFGGETERERGDSTLFSPEIPLCLGWSKPKPGIRNSTWVPPCMAVTQILQPSPLIPRVHITSKLQSENELRLEPGEVTPIWEVSTLSDV